MYFVLDVATYKQPLIEDRFISLPTSTNTSEYTVGRALADIKNGYDYCIRLPKSPSQTDVVSTFINEFAIYMKLLRTSEYRAVFDFVCSTFFRQRYALLRDNLIASTGSISRSSVQPLEKGSIYFISDYTDMGLYNFAKYRRKRCLNPTLKEYYLRMKKFDAEQKEEFKTSLLLSSPAVLFLNINRLALKVCRRSPNIVSIFASINEGSSIEDRVTSAVEMPWGTDSLLLREAGNLHPNCGGKQQVQLIGFKEHRSSRQDEVGIKANLNYKSSKSKTPYEPIYHDVTGVSPYAYPVRVGESHDRSYDNICRNLDLDMPGDDYLTDEALKGATMTKLRHIHMNSISFLDPDALAMIASMDDYKNYGKSGPDKLYYGPHQVIRKLVGVIISLLDYSRTFAMSNYSDYGQLKNIFIRNNLSSSELTTLSDVFTNTVEFYKIANYGLKSGAILTLFKSVQSSAEMTNYSKTSMYKTVPIKIPKEVQQRLVKCNSTLSEIGEVEALSLGGASDNAGFYAKQTFIERMLRTCNLHEYLSVSNRLLSVISNSQSTIFRQRIDQLFKISANYSDSYEQENEYKSYAADLGLALSFNRCLRYPVGTICSKWMADPDTRLNNTDFLMQDIGIGIYNQSTLLNDCETLRMSDSALIESFWLKMTDYPISSDKKLLVRQFRTFIPLLSNQFDVIRELNDPNVFKDTIDQLPSDLRNSFWVNGLGGVRNVTAAGRQLYQFILVVKHVIDRIEE